MGAPSEITNPKGPSTTISLWMPVWGKVEISVPFSYSSRLEETILLVIISCRFPGKTLHWDAKNAEFSEEDSTNI